MNPTVDELQAEVARLRRLLDDPETVDPAWRLNRQQRIVVGRLMRAKGQIVHKSLLIEALWRDDNEPDNAEKVFEAFLARLRRRLPGHIQIIGERFLGYRIVVRQPG